jgi:hypothetical protein
MFRPSTLCILLCGNLVLQAQFQQVHDVANTTTTPELSPLLLPNGHTVTHHWQAGLHIFRNYDTNGVLVWSRGIQGPLIEFNSYDHNLRMLNDGPDGFAYVLYLGYTLTPGGEEPFTFYTKEHLFELVTVSGSGEQLSAVRGKKTFVEGSGTDIMISLDAARTPDGGHVILLATEQFGPPGSIELLKIDSAGELEWSKSVGVHVSDPATPTYTHGGHVRPRVVVSAEGIIHFIEGGGLGLSALRMGALDPAGDLLWMKHYVYANIDPSADFHGLALDAAGNVHAGGSLYTAVGRFHYFLRTASDGTLQRGDLYRTPYQTLYGHFGLDDQARRVHITHNQWSNAPSHGLVVADTLGSPAQFLQRADEVVLPNNVFVLPQGMHVAGNMIALSSLLHHEHVDLAFTSRYETIMTLDTDEIAACLMSDSTLAHIPIPLSIMNTVDLLSTVAIDVSTYYSVEPTEVVFTEVGTDALEPVCSFAAELLQEPTTVLAPTLSNELPLVVNTLVPQGSPIFLNIQGIRMVEVYSAHGSLVQRTVLNGSGTVATTDLPVGLYVLRATTPLGNGVRIGRVLIE